MAEDNQQAFVSGFSLGIFAGVVGYYLFGTDQGKKIRQKLIVQWEEAHQYLIAEGVLEKKTEFKNLGELLQFAKEELLKKLEVKMEKKQSTHKKRSYTNAGKQKKFKGI